MAEEEPTEPTEEEIFQANHLTAQQLSEEVVEKICTKGGKILYEKYIKKKVVPYISHRTLRDVVSMVNWLNLVRDKGEPENDRASNWYVDEEPPVVAVDTWASGSVQVRQKQSLYVPLSSGIGTDADTEVAPSVAGTARTRGSKRPGSRLSKGTRGTRGGSKGKQKDPEQLLAERIITLSDEQLGIREPTDNNEAGGKPKVTKEEKARLRAIRDMERAERAALKRIESEKQRKIDEKNAHEAMMKELKGKEWTLDRDGKVIIIKPPNPAKMPSMVDEPDIFVSTAAKTGVDKRPETSSSSVKAPDGSSSPGKRGSSASPGKKKRRNKNQDDSNQFFRESVSQQPPLVNSMNVQTGVTLTEGDQKKAGPRAEENPKRMTRSAFLMHQTLVDEDEQAGTSGPIGGNISSNDGPESSSKINTTAGLASAFPEMEAKIASAMADMDILGGGRALSSAGGGSIDGGDINDENIKLISAADWGANPAQTREPNKPPLVHKPTNKERYLTLGRDGEARDRKYMNKIAGSSPTRLPPPLNVGSVVGHGLGDLGDSVVVANTLDTISSSSGGGGGGSLNGGGSTSSVKVGPGSPISKPINLWGEVGPMDSIKITEAAAKYFQPTSSALESTESPKRSRRR
jgi:hypothetical protein